jgi:hypothetical protein
MEASGKPRRVDIGFSGGQAFPVRLGEEEYRKLQSALEAGSERWHTVTSEDAEVLIDLGQVAYVRLDTEQRGVGFSGP